MRYGNNIVFRRDDVFESDEKATLTGVNLKAALLLGITILASTICMMFVTKLDTNNVAAPIVIFGYLICPILTFIFSLIMGFKPLTAKALSIPYAILEGVSIGAVCGLLKYALGAIGGYIAGLAFVGTLAIFLGCAVLYMSGLVKVTSGFRRFVIMLGVSLIIMSLVIVIAGLFNRAIFSLFYGDGVIGIVFAVFGVIVASLYTMLTLDNAKRMVDAGLSKTFEWYCAFGIVLNIIWLFWEVLRLVILITSRVSRR